MSREDEQSEQELCLECGLCCRGTWFTHVVLQPHEVVDARRVGMIVAEVDGVAAVMHPCSCHRDGHCSTYDQWRPRACNDYRCKLLTQVEAGQMTRGEALGVVRSMRSMTDRIRSEVGPDAGGLLRGELLARLDDVHSESRGLDPLTASTKADLVALHFGYRTHFQTPDAPS